MEGTLGRINRFFEQVPDRVRRHKIPLWTGFVLVTLLIAIGIPRLTIDMSMEAFYSEDEPVKKAYDHFRSFFGGDESVYIVYEALDGDIFSPTSLKALTALTDELTQYRLHLPPDAATPLDHITDVKTLINVKYMEAKGGTLYSRNFVGHTLPQTEKERETLRSQALLHPDYPLVYLSKDSVYGGIVVKTDFNAEPIEATKESDALSSDPKKAPTHSLSLDADEESEDLVMEMNGEAAAHLSDAPPLRFKKTEMQEYEPFVEALNKILDQPAYQGVFKFHPVGNPVLMTFFSQIIFKEMRLILGGLFLLIFLMLLILFRSFSAILWPIIIVGVSVIWVVGLIGHMGVTMTSMVEIIVFLVLAVGVADAVHILSGYIYYRDQDLTHQEALRWVFKKSGLACFLTSLTTAIGLLALTVSPILPVKTFGIFAALGVLFAFLITVFILPLMMDIWSPLPSRPKQTAKYRKKHLVQELILKIDQIPSRHAKAILAIFAGFGLVFLIGFVRVNVDYNILKVLDEKTPLRQTYELVDRHMGGTGNMEILVETGVIDGLKDPRVLLAMDRLQSLLETAFPAIVVDTYSLVNVTKDAYKILNEDRPEMYRIPDAPNVLAQTLFLFNNANPKDRRLLVSDDYKKARITLNLKNMGSKEGMRFIQQVNSAIATNFAPLRSDYPALKLTTTGQLSLMTMLIEYLSWSQIKSFGLALGIISILLLLVFGSLRIGLIAIMPNLFPILTIFGLMGYLKIPLDTDTLLIAPIIIGIAVDDTIHFLTHYQIDMVKYQDPHLAVRHTLQEAGQAICFTSLILSVGFFIFVASFHKGLSYFGIFSAVAIITALLSDLFLLPAMLVFFRKRS